MEICRRKCRQKCSEETGHNLWDSDTGIKSELKTIACTSRVDRHVNQSAVCLATGTGAGSPFQKIIR